MIEKRDPQGFTCIPGVDNYYKLVGDGNPRQNFKITELGATMIGCPGSVSKTWSHTTGWSIGGGFNPGNKIYDFASLSFSVSESTTNSITDGFTCTAAWAEMCILSYQAVTAVTVDFYVHTFGCGQNTNTYQGRGVVYLPNQNSQSSGGSVMRRGVNDHANHIQCRGGSDDRTVDFFCGPPGSSSWFSDNGGVLGPESDAYLAQRQPAGCGIPIEVFDWTQA